MDMIILATTLFGGPLLAAGALAIGFLFVLGSRLFALSANAQVDHQVEQELSSYPVAAGECIYNGALVGINPAGYLKAFVPGDRFAGIAHGKQDNTSGSDGDLDAQVYLTGDFQYTLASAAQTDLGKPVYATADNAIALTGHPDAYVGRILSYDTTNTVTIRLKSPGERAPNDGSSIDIDLDFSRVLVANQDEATATLSVGGSPIKTAAVGAGLTAGTTGILMDESAGELRLLLDNDSEAENLTIETPQVFNITKGITFEFEGRLKTAGGAATDDVDLGLMALSGGITATERANMDATTAGVSTIKLHLDANANDIYAGSDDNSTVVSATDTTVDNSLTVNTKGKLIVRPTGACEVWIAGARVLSTTTFAVATSGLMAGIVNLEKSTGTGVPEVRVKRLRVAGAIA